MNRKEFILSLLGIPLISKITVDKFTFTNEYRWIQNIGTFKKQVCRDKIRWVHQGNFDNDPLKGTIFYEKQMKIISNGFDKR